MTRLIHFLNRLCDCLRRAAMALLVVFGAVMSVVVMLQILFRFVIYIPLPWSEELARYLMIWTGMVGSFVALREGRHIGVTLVVNRLPPRAAAGDIMIMGVTTGVSIGGLFAAGVIPGILQCLAMMAMAYYFAVKHDYPRDPVPLTWRRVWREFVSAGPALVAPVIIIGGILAGVFTPTESAVVAVFYGLVMVLNLSIGLITPPVGVLLFVVCGITGYPFALVTRWTLPFLAAHALTLVVASYFPIVVMWVPELFGYV
jgi:hypothetical protein